MILPALDSPALDSIESLEGALLDRLRAGFPKLDVQAFPDRGQEFRPTHPNASLLIQYQGAEFGATTALGAVSLARKLIWEITLYAKSLSGPLGSGGKGGALPLLDALRAHLTGWRPRGAIAGMLPERESFLKREASFWIYAARYRIDAPFVQKFETASAAPLKQIARRSTNGTSFRLIPPASAGEDI